MDKIDLIRVQAPPSGTEVYVYLAGTTDQATIFADVDKTIEITQPIILGDTNSHFYVDDQQVDVKFVHPVYTNGYFTIENAIIPKSEPHSHPYVTEDAIAAAAIILKIKEALPEFTIAIKTNVQPSLDEDLILRLSALGFSPDDVIWVQQ